MLNSAGAFSLLLPIQTKRDKESGKQTMYIVHEPYLGPLSLKRFAAFPTYAPLNT